uniref:DH domain-containing protein n=1 Tax=Macrostomum lignano TaxID=282301 RepID=A0A1I8JQ52_9PLAT
LGPPALAQLSIASSFWRICLNRLAKAPVYSCGMRGVVACFNWILEKARVSRIAFLVHCLGGGIRARCLESGYLWHTGDDCRLVEAAWMARDQLLSIPRIRHIEMASVGSRSRRHVVPFASLTASSSSASSTNPAVTQIVVNDLLDFRSIPALQLPANQHRLRSFLYALKQQCLESSASAVLLLLLACPRLHPPPLLPAPPQRVNDAVWRLSSPLPSQLPGRHHRRCTVCPVLSSAASLLDATADSSALSPVAERRSCRCESVMRHRQCVVSGWTQNSQAKSTAAAGSLLILVNSVDYRKLLELAHTEANYVSILGVIVNVIRREVADASRPENWSTPAQVGKVFTDRGRPAQPSVSTICKFWFETSQRRDGPLEQRDPRFRAYLRLCLSRKECLRQSLKELLIRPVQRLRVEPVPQQCGRLSPQAGAGGSSHRQAIEQPALKHQEPGNTSPGSCSISAEFADRISLHFCASVCRSDLRTQRAARPRSVDVTYFARVRLLTSSVSNLTDRRPFDLIGSISLSGLKVSSIRDSSLSDRTPRRTLTRAVSAALQQQLSVEYGSRLLLANPAQPVWRDRSASRIDAASGRVSGWLAGRLLLPPLRPDETAAASAAGSATCGKPQHRVLVSGVSSLADWT